jgi:glycerol uptake facilitator-like aquaporin
MAERLTDDPGLRLLQNAAATAGVLVALILALGSASGAHFNPAVATRCWDQLALRVRR